MEPDIARDVGPWSWRVRRWVAPVTLAVLVAAALSGVRLAVDESGPPGKAALGKAAPQAEYRPPRFLISVGWTGSLSQKRGSAPLFEVHTVHTVQADGQPRLVDSVREPLPAGVAQEIVPGPKDTFLVTSSRAEPCESRLSTFRLTGDGHVTGMASLRGGTTPGLVAGVAISPDGRRVAYTTAPCTGDLRPAGPPRATVTVLDTGTGKRRTWNTPGHKIVGSIVWAEDSRTLGFTVSDLVPKAASGEVPGGVPEESPVNATVRILDTDAPVLGAGRALFRAPAGAIAKVTMAPDGRTGYGSLRKGRPATIVLFTFTEHGEMRITQTYRPDPNKLVLHTFGWDGARRYACLNGPDAFGRMIDDVFDADHPSSGACGSATVS